MRQIVEAARCSGKGSLLVAVLVGCSGGEIDRADELGDDVEDYELVIVETTRVESSRIEKAEEAVEAIADTTAVLLQPVVFDDEGEYTVQIGIYDAKEATHIVGELSREGYPAYAIPGPDASKGVRVRIGYFKTETDAQRFGAIFKEDRGGEFWVDRRRNE